MRLLAEYRASLKSPAVEEPIDLFVHRPLAFVIAKLAAHTPATPNHLTATSMALGCVAGLTLFAPDPRAPVLGALLLFLSQVIDCSDGMLARIRGGGSPLGRMLDGCADSFTMLFAVAGTLHLMLAKLPSRTGWQPLALTALTVLAAYTTSLHTSGYDYYKNLYLRVTIPGSTEGEDVERASARCERAKRYGTSLLERTVGSVYLGYLRSQRRLIAWFDPVALVRLDALPGHEPARAAEFERHMRPLMWVWRTLFGVGSLVFGLALFLALGHPELFLLFRLLILNAVFFLYLLPGQRAATRRAWTALGVAPSRGDERARLLHA
jgi:phosphatidylglycerophosphate synthase